MAAITLGTILGAYLATSQANAEVVVNPNMDLLTKYATGLDTALALTLTGATTLTDIQVCASPWNFLGALGAGAAITIPVHSFVRAILNLSGQTLTFGYATGATQTVASGATSILLGDGTDVYKIV